MGCRSMAPPDIAIVDAAVHTGQPGDAGIHTATTVAIEGDTITHVGATRARDRRAAVVIDGQHLLVMPGMIDAHAHTGHRLAVGLAQDVPEREWMDRALGPVAATASQADREAGSRLAVLEAIAAGVTTVCEYAEDVKALVEAAHVPAGLRCVAVETINEVVERPDDGPYRLDEAAGTAARDRADGLIEWATTHPRVTAAYGPQALDMVTPATMDWVVDRSQQQGVRYHVHVAQGGRERRQLQARYGVDSAVELLDARGWLGERLVAAHLHGATDDQRTTLARSGTSMVGCPSSIGAIDGIVPPIVAFREAGGRVGIGSDQAPGGAGGHHLLAEVRQAWLLAKVAAADPTALPAWEALSLATSEGARVLGLGGHTGQLAPGQRADIACFRLDTMPLVGAGTAAAATPLAALVAAGGRASAEHVIVDGSFVRRNGRFVTLDADDIVATANEQAEALHERAAPAWHRAGSAVAEAADGGPFGIGGPDQ